MIRRPLSWLVAGSVLLVAACSSGAAGSAGAGSAGAPSAAASAAAPSGLAGACRQMADPGAVAVSIKDFAFDPDTIEATTGSIITFTNTGFEPHNATLDAGGCATSTLQTDQHDGLRIDVPGTYTFHCTVHAQMTGTIKVSG